MSKRIAAMLTARHKWMSKHLLEVYEEYAGKWVAINGHGVQASCTSFKGLMHKLSMKQRREYTVMYVPCKHDQVWIS